MNSGPELDVLVAIKVMGCSPWPGRPDAVRASLTQFKPCLPPEYSTDIAAAWKVVEKLTAKESITMEIMPDAFNKEYSVSIKFEDKLGDAYGPFYFLSQSAPHAICLAALRSVGVEL